MNIFIIHLLLKDYYKSKISEEARKLLLILIKNDSSCLLNDELICYNYYNILSSEIFFTCDKKNTIFHLFEEIVKEGIIKKGENGSEIVEEMIFIGEEMNKKKDVVNLTKELINKVNIFTKISKEKGFEVKPLKNKNKKIASFIFNDWKKICKGEV